MIHFCGENHSLSSLVEIIRLFIKKKLPFGNREKNHPMDLILTGFSGMALMACLFAILYLLVGIEEKSDKKVWLVLLIVAVWLRIGKSFFYFLLPHISDYGVALGFLGYASMGPLLLFYFRTPKRSQWLPHFIFPLAGTLSIIFYREYAIYWYASCSLSFVAYFSYLIYCQKQQGLAFTSWDNQLLATIISISVIFLSQLFLPTLSLYVAGTGAASLVISIWFVLLLKNPKRLKVEVKPKGYQLDQTQIQTIKRALLEEKFYRNPELTLQGFARQIEIPSYLISAIVKQEFGRSFPKTINHLRIEEVKDTLQEPSSLQLKVEALGYDVGFSSPSSFYAAFKKETGQSPRLYQKNMMYH